MNGLYKKIDGLWKRSKKWEKGSALGDFVVTAVKTFFFVTITLLIYAGLFDGSTLSKIDTASDSTELSSESCTVAGINLHGTILTYLPLHAEGDPLFDYDSVSSEDIISIVKQANADPEIQAIVVEVDSVGGSPVAGEEIASVIKSSTKPVVAFIRDIGVSAAYWSISSADKIFASKNSDVGGIGVTSSYLSNAEKNKKEGYTYVQLSSGKYKDTGSPDKVLTAEEKELFLRDINIIHGNFVEAVSQNRKIPIEEVRSFADGSTVLGERAKILGLIDEVGGIGEVETYLEKIIGEKPDICWQ